MIRPNERCQWLIMLEEMDSDEGTFYYPDEESIFIGNEMEAYVEGEKRANDWENKTGSLCGKIIIEWYGSTHKTETRVRCKPRLEKPLPINYN